jgi:hypothetical protein
VSAGSHAIAGSTRRGSKATSRRPFTWVSGRDASRRSGSPASRAADRLR